MQRITREFDLEKQRWYKLEFKVTSNFSVECFKDSPEDMQFCTGLPSYDTFIDILRFIDPSENGERMKAWSTTYAAEAKTSMDRPRSLRPQDEPFLLLVRLRLGLYEKDSAYHFHDSIATVSHICTTWISYVYVHVAQLPLWASREEVDEGMPTDFKEKYPTTRVTLHATEIKCQVPSLLVLQSETSSSYKSANTFKGFVGICR